jgi:hypothetical protein
MVLTDLHGDRFTHIFGMRNGSTLNLCPLQISTENPPVLVCYRIVYNRDDRSARNLITGRLNGFIRIHYVYYVYIGVYILEKLLLILRWS